MRWTKYLVLPMALMMLFGSNVDARRKNKKAKSETQVDTCSVDTFSYAIGMANVDGLKHYMATRMSVDTTYMEDFINGFDAKVSPEEVKKAIAYCAGLQISQQIKNEIIPMVDKQIANNDSVKTIVPELFIEGFRNGITGNESKMTRVKAQELATKQMEYYGKMVMEQKYGANRKAGEVFLKVNAKEKGVKTLDSGVQYKVLQKGTGEIPSDTSTVKLHYEGRLIDGTIFDSSYKRNEPTTFACNQVIKGFSEALTHMPVGSKWEIYIPQELGYGAREAGKIPPFSALIFTVELLEIQK